MRIRAFNKRVHIRPAFVVQSKADVLRLMPQY